MRMPGSQQLEKMEKKVIKEQTPCVEYTYRYIILKLLLQIYTLTINKWINIRWSHNITLRYNTDSRAPQEWTPVGQPATVK